MFSAWAKHSVSSLRKGRGKQEETSRQHQNRGAKFVHNILALYGVPNCVKQVADLHMAKAIPALFPDFRRVSASLKSDSLCSVLWTKVCTRALQHLSVLGSSFFK
ncbi:hypothetical protein D8B26_002710 [Coccidioides posadasii str. Silveira]|uniref:uncharacterized protein n=1 Tax=Coccidioides posadasii (strain RMSCC 757 / Silveira) TaxID=443226 RepID=UPI001BED74A7|nr:hypothetical protein D8B26_002710 [Coccidioides posadasii str. Silveira]